MERQSKGVSGESGAAMQAMWKTRISALWSRLLRAGQMAGRREKKLLRLREMLSLGERRFLAVVEFDRQELLIAGTANSITLLQALSPNGCGPEPGLAAEIEIHAGDGKRTCREAC